MRTSTGADERNVREDPRSFYAAGATRPIRDPSERQLPTYHCHAVPIREYQSGQKSPLPSARPLRPDVRSPPYRDLTGRSISEGRGGYSLAFGAFREFKERADGWL